MNLSKLRGIKIYEKWHSLDSVKQIPSSKQTENYFFLLPQCLLFFFAISGSWLLPHWLPTSHWSSHPVQLSYRDYEYINPTLCCQASHTFFISISCFLPCSSYSVGWNQHILKATSLFFGVHCILNFSVPTLFCLSGGENEVQQDFQLIFSSLTQKANVCDIFSTW